MKQKRRAYRPGDVNIGMRNRVLRLAYGLIFFSATIWAWAFFTVNGFHPIFKLYLFLPFYIGFLGMYQAVFGFCVFHSRRHTHDMR